MTYTSTKKLLYIDIEWAPALIYTFDPFNVHISVDHIVSDGGLLCFCAHWAGSKDFLFFSRWDDGPDYMAAAALELLSEADAVVTYNGDKYDLPKLRGAIALQGLKPPPPPTSIDIIKSVKKLGLLLNRLAYVGPLLGIGGKMKHEGFKLWRSVEDGDPKAQDRMRRYCIQDVRLLVKLYNRIKPFIQDHPNLIEVAEACGNCGSHHLQNRGFRRTKFFKTQRLQCQDCGAWSTGTRTKLP